MNIRYINKLEAPFISKDTNFERIITILESELSRFNKNVFIDHNQKRLMKELFLKENSEDFIQGNVYSYVITESYFQKTFFEKASQLNILRTFNMKSALLAAARYVGAYIYPNCPEVFRVYIQSQGKNYFLEIYLDHSDVIEPRFIEFDPAKNCSVDNFSNSDSVNKGIAVIF